MARSGPCADIHECSEPVHDERERGREGEKERVGGKEGGREEGGGGGSEGGREHVHPSSKQYNHFLSTPFPPLRSTAKLDPELNPYLKNLCPKPVNGNGQKCAQTTLTQAPSNSPPPATKPFFASYADRFRHTRQRQGQCRLAIRKRAVNEWQSAAACECCSKGGDSWSESWRAAHSLIASMLRLIKTA